MVLWNLSYYFIQIKSGFDKNLRADQTHAAAFINMSIGNWSLWGLRSRSLWGRLLLMFFIILLINVQVLTFYCLWPFTCPSFAVSYIQCCINSFVLFFVLDPLWAHLSCLSWLSFIVLLNWSPLCFPPPRQSMLVCIVHKNKTVCKLWPHPSYINWLFACGKSTLKSWNAEQFFIGWWMCVCLLWGSQIIILGYNCLCGKSSSQLKHEPFCTFQNLLGMNIQLHTAGSVEGQQTTFSRKLAGKQLVLRVSSDKQTVTVCTQGECYQPAIISRQKFFLPKDLPKHASIKSSNWFRFLSVSWEEQVTKHCKCHCRHLFTCVFLSSMVSLLSSCSGADDLLPILSFVALQCQCPQLVSECAALEEFIHEGWVIQTEK